VRRGRWPKTPTQNSQKHKTQGATNIAPTKNALETLRGIGKRLYSFMSDYSAHFVVRGKDVSKHASDYLSGLLGTERRKNLERIHNDIPESNYQAIQQFVSDSPWNEVALMNQVAGEANQLFGGHRHSALMLDETSFVKKGKSSVGVQRQYCGRLGKTENCQLGVFA
jgi:SRSO17 transposase